VAETPALSLHSALTKRSAAARPVPVLLEGLGRGWVLLPEVLIGGPGEAPARIDLVLLHAGLGIALLERAPRWTADAPARLRQRLELARFPAIFPGELPVVHCQLHPTSLDRLPRLLTESFGAQPPLSLPGGTAWVGTVRRALTQPSPLAEAPLPPPEPAPPRWGLRFRRTLAGMAAVVGLGGLALLLLLRSAPLAGSAVERSRAVVPPSGRLAATGQPSVVPVAGQWLRAKPAMAGWDGADPLRPEAMAGLDLALDLAGGEVAVSAASAPAIAAASPEDISPAEATAAAQLSNGDANPASPGDDATIAAMVPGHPGDVTDAVADLSAPEIDAAIPALPAHAPEAGPAQMVRDAATGPDAVADTIPPDDASDTTIAAEPEGRIREATNAQPIPPATETMETASGNGSAVLPSSDSAVLTPAAASPDQPEAAPDTTAEASPAGASDSTAISTVAPEAVEVAPVPPDGTGATADTSTEANPALPEAEAATTTAAPDLVATSPSRVDTTSDASPATPEGEATATTAAPELAATSPSPIGAMTDADPATPESEAVATSEVPDTAATEASPIAVPGRDATTPAPPAPAEATAAPATAPPPTAEAIPAQPVEAKPAAPAAPPPRPEPPATAVLPLPAAPVEPPPPLAAAPAVPPPATAPRPTARRRADPAVLAALMRRGDALLATGDVSGARRFYERAAEAGSAEAARAAGRTHDPAALAALGTRGIRPDPQAAAAWYRRADALAASEHAECPIAAPC
jgi:hypothetical protein